MWTTITNWYKSIVTLIADANKKQVFTPGYRVVEINKTEVDEYVATIQLINKNIVFQAKPEEILAKDDLVNQFSPCDVRTLTYLGYLSLNNPQYKILAQRLSTTNDKVLFALRKRGAKQVIIKSADEILKEKDILNNLGAEDSHVVGYTVASESMLEEKKAKELLTKKHQ